MSVMQNTPSFLPMATQVHVMCYAKEQNRCNCILTYMINGSSQVVGPSVSYWWLISLVIIVSVIK